MGSPAHRAQPLLKALGAAWFGLMLVLSAVPVRAQVPDWLGLYQTDAEAFVRFDGRRRRGLGDPDRDADFEDWLVGVRISQSGFILDPRIARFDLMLEPAYNRSLQDTAVFDEESSGDWLNYAVSADLMEGAASALAFEIAARQDSTFLSGTLGSLEDNTVASQALTGYWRFAPFPMQFGYERKSLEQDFISGQSGVRTQRDETQRIWHLRGRSSKLALDYEHRIIDDRVNGRDQDFDEDNLDVLHSLPWGRNSELRSRLDFQDRRGFAAFRQLTLEEYARIQHRPNLWSINTYRYTETVRTQDSLEHAANVNLIHDLYGNLSTRFKIGGSMRQDDSQDESRWQTGLDASYSKADLLFGGSVSAGLGVSYQITDRDSNLGLIDVIQEAQLVPLNGAVLLDLRFIASGSLLVTDADGTVVFAEGIDFNVVPLINDLTQLQIIPGGRIDVGDRILVSYQAQALPSQEYATTFTRANLALNWGWLRLSHRDTKSDDEPRSGSGMGFLNDTRDTISNIEMRWNHLGMDGAVTAERVFIGANQFESTTVSLRGNVGWTMRSGTRWNLSATQSNTERGEIETDLSVVEMAVGWNPRPRLTIRPTVSYWDREDRDLIGNSGSRDEQYFTAGAVVRWQYRRITLDMRYQHSNRRTMSDPTFGVIAFEDDEDSLMFHLSRRF